MRLLCAVLLLLASCAPSAEPSADPFGAFNDRGGAERNNDFSASAPEMIVELQPESFHSLTGGLRTSPLDLGDGRRILLCSGSPEGDAIIAMTLLDSVLWRTSLPTGNHPLPGLATDSTGVLYLSTTNCRVWAVGRNGKVLWNRAVGEVTDGPVIPTPPLALGEGVIVGTTRGDLVRFDGAGRNVWQIRRGGAFGDRPCGHPHVGIVGVITFNDYARRDSLLIVDAATGKELSSRPLGGRMVAEPILTPRAVVIGTATIDSGNRRVPQLEATTHDGRPLWSLRLPLMPRGISSDAAGALYVACAGNAADLNGGAIVAVDTVGHRRWTVLLGSGVSAPVAVTAQWIYFVARREGRTGLYTYGLDGTFGAFLPIDVLPDVSSAITMSGFGTLVLSGLDAPVLLIGG